MSSYNGHISPVGVNDVMLSDKLFIVQSDIIRKLASEKDCVIVGRCADDLLSSYEGADAYFHPRTVGLSAQGGYGTSSAQRVERAHAYPKDG